MTEQLPTILLGGQEGRLDEVASALGGADVLEALPESGAAAGQLIIVEGPAGLPQGNAFSCCRAIKREPRALVFLILDEDDPFGAEIARFALADGVLVRTAGGAIEDFGPITKRQAAMSRKRAPVDELLKSLEGQLAGDSERRDSAIQRILEADGRDDLLTRITDPETGLFDGPFASFKLDEEFKRASRFHHPLSAILIDCGEGVWPGDDADRRLALAEVASVFLNECRDIDILARFTETVFLFLLPGTGAAGARAVARRMVDGLRERSIGADGRLDPAAGIATVPWAGIRDRATFLARAEGCLKLARDGQGDDGVCSAAD